MMNDHDPVLDDLSALIDGDEAAIARHAAHLAECDACRDARHEATELARKVRVAGADHVAREDLADVVWKALDAAKQAPAEKPSTTTTTTTSTSTSTKAKQRSWLYAVGVAAAAAAGLLGVVKLRGGGSTAAVTDAGIVARAQIGARVERISRAASDGVAGLMVEDAGAFRAVAAGEVVRGRIKTDDRTRAWLTMDDGSKLSLDRATELILGGDRRFELIDGRVVADVAHVDGAPNARFVTPTGDVEVVGTELVLTATAELTSVRVTRGSVTLAARQGGAGAEVRAGEEGTITTTGIADVAPAPALASELAWAEMVDDVTSTTTDDAGLGALRAYKPGEARDRDWALALARHEVTVRLVGPVARTEITETFRNDSDVTLEGVYQFPLPADAKIDRLALDAPGGGFEEGAFVDKERAAKVWAGAIDQATPKQKRRPAELIWVPGRWKDPALLEWERGGRFELRIFPIPAHSSRTIKIGYTQVLAPSGRWNRYVYPLPYSKDGSTAAEELAVDVRVADTTLTAVRARGYELTTVADGGDVSMKLSAKGFVPRGDLVIEHRPDATAELRAWTFAGAAASAPVDRKVGKAKAKQLGLDPDVLSAQRTLAADVRPAAVIALRPELPRWREAAPHDYVIVVDASQSMVGERLTRATALTGAMLGQVDRRDRFTILVCDAECRDLPGGVQAPSAPALTAAHDWLSKQTAAGASDVVESVRAALATAPREAGREPWIVYIGDGFATTGFRRTGDVEALITDAAKAAGARITTVGIGGDADATVLAAIARAGGGNYVPWVPGQRLGTAAMTVLETTFGTALRDATVELPAGLVDAAPTRLPTIRAGEEVLIAARFAGEVKGEVVLRGVLAGQPWIQRYPITLTASTAAGNGFVPRIWAAHSIDELERAGRGEDHAKIVALSQGYGVLSRATSLLVLESDAMFEAFGIDRAPDAPTWSGSEALDEVSAGGTVAYDDGDEDLAAAPATAAAGKGFAGGTKSPAKPSDDRAEEKELDRLGDSDKPTTTSKAKKDVGRRADPSPRGPGEWMKKVYFRVGAVTSYDGVSDQITQAVAAAEAALTASPDSRDRHRALVQALAYAGELDRAATVAKAWLERDALDPQALDYLAGVLGRQGHRDEALRVLGGVVDLAPDDAALQLRLARADERAGRTATACSHRVAHAAILPTDAAVAGAALRCLRALGRQRDASVLARGLGSDALRDRAEAAADKPTAAERIAGDLVVNAQWTGSSDIDVTIITPQGQRVSWMGGRADVTAAHAGDQGREQLALKKVKKGRYLVELSRTTVGETTPVKGTVEVTILGVSRTLAFDLSGDRATLGRVVVSMDSKLVPVR